MCASCFTQVDAMAWNAVGVAAAASVGWRAVRVRARHDRRRIAYAETAAFLRELGHDPIAVIGEPPMSDRVAVRVRG